MGVISSSFGNLIRKCTKLKFNPGNELPEAEKGAGNIRSFVGFFVRVGILFLHLPNLILTGTFLSHPNPNGYFPKPS